MESMYVECNECGMERRLSMRDCRLCEVIGMNVGLREEIRGLKEEYMKLNDDVKALELRKLASVRPKEVEPRVVKRENRPKVEVGRPSQTRSNIGECVMDETGWICVRNGGSGRMSLGQNREAGVECSNRFGSLGEDESSERENVKHRRPTTSKQILESEWIKPKHTFKSHGVNHNNLVLLGNRFDCLSDAVDPEFEKIKVQPCSRVKVFGDSQVRGLSTHLKEKCLVNCYPGATVNRIDSVIEGAQMNDGDHVIIHVGGNDNDHCPSEELMRKYLSLLHRLKEKRKGCNMSVTLTGIVPRMNKGSYWYSKALGINNRVYHKCRELNINFIDLWDAFYDRCELFNSDGVHLNNQGRKVLAEHLRGQFKIVSSN